MESSVLGLYDPLAEYYHLIFLDWNASIARQAKILNSILAANGCGPSLRILDCACGIGTQALGLARLGHSVVASDLSPSAVRRASREAATRGLSMAFYVADMTTLSEIPDAGFDVVIVMDNALPHLSREDLARAIRAMRSKLKSGGLLIASIRDYDALAVQRPTMEGPAFYGEEGTRRIVHQVWEWLDQERYRVHLYMTVQSGEKWESRHFAGDYRTVQRSEISAAMAQAGFVNTRWLMPSESGLYIPLVVGNASN